MQKEKALRLHNSDIWRSFKARNVRSCVLIEDELVILLEDRVEFVDIWEDRLMRETGPVDFICRLGSMSVLVLDNVIQVREQFDFRKELIHKTRVRCITSCDSLLASADDEKVVVWNISNTTTLSISKCDALALSVDGKRCAAAIGALVQIWNIEDKKITYEFKMSVNVKSLAFSCTGTLASIDGGTLMLTDDKKSVTHEVTGTKVCFSSDGQLLHVFGNDLSQIFVITSSKCGYFMSPAITNSDEKKERQREIVTDISMGNQKMAIAYKNEILVHIPRSEEPSDVAFLNLLIASDSGILYKYKRALFEFRHVPLIVRTICVSLRTICINTPDVSVRICRDFYGDLHSILELYIDDPTVVATVLELSVVITLFGKRPARVLFSKIIRFLQPIYTRYRNVPEVMQYWCGLQGNIGLDQDNQRELGRLRIEESLLDIVHTYRTNATVSRFACVALLPNCLQPNKLFYVHRYASHLEVMLDLHYANTGVMQGVWSALLTLVNEETAHMMATTFAPRFRRVIETNLRSFNVIGYLCGFILNLLHYENISEIIVQQNMTSLFDSILLQHNNQRDIVSWVNQIKQSLL